jgi:hypothetical protein
MRVKGALNDLMDKDDWAIIIGPEGTPKGVFIPEDADENDCPTYIIKMLESAGINFFEDLPQPTLH